MLRAVQAQPETIGRGDELRGVVKELSADLSSGVLAVDDEAADVAGVVGRVVPQLAAGWSLGVKVAITASPLEAT